MVHAPSGHRSVLGMDDNMGTGCRRTEWERMHGKTQMEGLCLFGTGTVHVGLGSEHSCECRTRQIAGQCTGQ